MFAKLSLTGVEVVPLAHGVHCEDPGPEKVFAGQLEQLVTASPVLKLPAAQSVQALLLTYLPAGQLKEQDAEP